MHFSRLSRLFRKNGRDFADPERQSPSRANEPTDPALSPLSTSNRVTSPASDRPRARGPLPSIPPSYAPDDPNPTATLLHPSTSMASNVPNNPRPFIDPATATSIRVPHRETDESRFPYDRLPDDLGAGKSAVVQRVKHKSSGKVFACKTFENLNDDIDTVKEKFKRVRDNEGRMMSQLQSHPHMVKIIETFVMKRTFRIIMSPVAEMDLHRLLLKVRDNELKRSDYELSLIRAFGCLSSGLAFIHKMRIRHKDIKPENILWLNGFCIFTDFGISQQFSESEGFTTYISTPPRTPRYCPPEIDKANRNDRSDVFSLGCVFYEILSTLYPEQIPFLPSNTCYHQHIEHIQDNLQKAAPDDSCSPYRCCMRMIREEKADRISSTDLVSWLADVEVHRPKFFCNDCRRNLSPAG